MELDAPRRNGDGARRVGPGPKRLKAGAAKGRLRLLHVGTPAQIDLRYPEATRADLRVARNADVVVLAGAVLARGGAEVVDGIAAAADAFLARGARQVVISLVGAPPAEFWENFYANCLDTGMPPGFALLQTRRWIRAKDKRFWAGVVVWGVPAR